MPQRRPPTVLRTAHRAVSVWDRLGLPRPPAWMAEGLCAQTDPDAFFPDKGGSNRAAKRICRACPVQAECRAYGLDHDERFGIWGGLSELDRRRLRKTTTTTSNGTQEGAA